MMQALLEQLGADAAERLRWLVCKRLGVFPYSDINDTNILKCGLHMVLDKRGEGAEFSLSSAFDADEFERLKEDGADGACAR